MNGWNAVELQVKDKKDLEGKIVIPKELNTSLNVGWQHRRYGSLYDPKYKIATKFMDLLMNSDLRSIIEEEEEDNIRSDLGMITIFTIEKKNSNRRGHFTTAMGYLITLGLQTECMGDMMIGITVTQMD
jgi:hypothetical protein